MTTYKSYAECKIANPDSEIVTTGKNWKWDKHAIGTFLACNSGIKRSDNQDRWVICNPADYCSSLKEFLDAGLKLANGDKYIDICGKCKTVVFAKCMNVIWNDDSERYILSAAALNGGCKIPAKTEQWTVYNNTLPLCDMTDEQAAMLFNAWRGGAVRQALNNSGFCDLPAKATPWFESVVYRIKSKSERELFIDKSLELMTSETERTMEQMFGELFDSGKFKYIDKTGHFGEII